MATQHASSHSRVRSSSDPFSDPSARSHRPPPPPPKFNSPSNNMPAAVPKSYPSSKDPHKDDITEAVRDTVTVRGQPENSPRNRVGRSQTALGPPPPNSAPRPTQGRRSQSQDSGNLVDKNRSSGKSKKKGSQHADVIDRLDFTGVGPMFHHDGPFDACAPSRNKHRNKAPMFAWTGQPDDLVAPRYGDSAYPAAHAYKAFTNDYPEPPKKKVDAIAEAWGIHEPEPFEEFFAGGGSTRPDGDTPTNSIFNGKESRNGAQRGRINNSETSREVRPRATQRRSIVPPPQPIFVPDPTEVVDTPNYSPTLSPPRRSKSLMQRIRKMRDAPNVPVSADYEQPPSPTSPLDNTNLGRPTHRSQNSFLGRFGAGSKATSASPSSVSDKPEPFVYIEASNNNKELPMPPPLQSESNTSSSAYFDGAHASGLSSPGLGRKTSIMQKVGRVVRGTR